MEVQLLDRLVGHKRNMWQQLLGHCGLTVDTLPDQHGPLRERIHSQPGGL